jgi:uncharacterized protein (DUF924 family)
VGQATRAARRTTTPERIVSFWRAAGPKKWWKKDAAFDRTVRSRFMAAHEAAARGELGSFEDTAEGALALVVLLDQFPRNMFRDSPHAFATDPLARSVASRAIARGFDHAIDASMQLFLYMPFMHSEALIDQENCVELHAALGAAGQSKFAVTHRDVIVKFGRFPHRNRILGRESTSEELAFLEGGGFAG